jgi:hypothetical protein
MFWAIYETSTEANCYRGSSQFSVKESWQEGCSMKQAVNGTKNTYSRGQSGLIAVLGFLPE